MVHTQIQEAELKCRLIIEIFPEKRTRLEEVQETYKLNVQAQYLIDVCDGYMWFRGFIWDHTLQRYVQMVRQAQ